MKTIVFSNQKGGVAKTTSALNTKDHKRIEHGGRTDQAGAARSGGRP